MKPCYITVYPTSPYPYILHLECMRISTIIRRAEMVPSGADNEAPTIVFKYAWQVAASSLAVIALRTRTKPS